MTWKEWPGHAANVAVNFLRQNVPESSTRLIAVALCFTGCIIALGTLWFAFKHPDSAGMVVSLGGILTALIASGCVAIINRTQNGQ